MLFCCYRSSGSSVGAHPHRGNLPPVNVVRHAVYHRVLVPLRRAAQDEQVRSCASQGHEEGTSTRVVPATDCSILR